MALQSGFFTSNNGDRLYQSEFFTSYFGSFIGNGVFPNPSNNLQVLANQDLTVNVSPGKGWINGYYLRNTSNYPINLQISDGTLNRIDRIVFALNFTNRQIEVYVKSGILSSNPTPPELQRDATIYELALADIRVNAGTVNITQAQITDLRPNSMLCGIVSGTVNQVDITTLYNQYEEEFRQLSASQRAEVQALVDELNGLIDGDAAGQLLTMINGLDDRVTDLDGRVTLLENEVTEIATQAEAESGTDNTKTMTPLRVRQSIDSNPNLIRINTSNNSINTYGVQDSKTRIFSGLLFEKQDTPERLVFVLPYYEFGFSGQIKVKINSNFLYSNATGGCEILYDIGVVENNFYANKKTVKHVSEWFANNYYVEDITFDGSRKVMFLVISKRQLNAINSLRIELEFNGFGSVYSLNNIVKDMYFVREDYGTLETAKLVGYSQEIENLKLSGVSAKTLIANAITAKGVPTNNNEEFSSMANKIGQIQTGPRSASGTANSSNEQIDFLRSFGDYTTYRFISVYNLGFTPSKITLYSNLNGENYTTIYDTDANGGYCIMYSFSGGSSYLSNEVIAISGNARVTNGSFTLPVILRSGSTVFNWSATE